MTDGGQLAAGLNLLVCWRLSRRLAASIVCHYEAGNCVKAFGFVFGFLAGWSPGKHFVFKFSITDAQGNL